MAQVALTCRQPLVATAQKRLDRPRQRFDAVNRRKKRRDSAQKNRKSSCYKKGTNGGRDNCRKASFQCKLIIIAAVSSYGVGSQAVDGKSGQDRRERQYDQHVS